MGPSGRTKGAEGRPDERLQRRKQPQQSPSAQGRPVMRSHTVWANSLHSDQCECHGGLTLAAALVRLVELLLRELAVAEGHVKVSHGQQLFDPPLRWARRPPEVARRQHAAAYRGTHATELRVEGRCGLGLLITAAGLARQTGGVVATAAGTGGGGSCGSCGGGGSGGGGGGGALAGWRRRRGVCERDALDL
eukprot:scaffold1814_cov56-Phaeocystis_antarctica.AAC.2